MLRIEVNDIIADNTVPFAHYFVLELLPTKARLCHVPLETDSLSNLDLRHGCLDDSRIQAAFAIVRAPHPSVIFWMRFVDRQIHEFNRVHDHQSIETCYLPMELRYCTVSQTDMCELEVGLYWYHSVQDCGIPRVDGGTNQSKCINSKIIE